MQSTNYKSMDLFGNALLDYQNGNYNEDIKTFSSLHEADIMPLPYLFRNYGKMPLIEQKALQLCRGNVLDIGCGAGSHSLFLQTKNIEVTALDSSKGAIEVCKSRGIIATQCCAIQDFENHKYDTLLLLMNGIGIVGKLEFLKFYLDHFRSLLKPKGQILMDSSDIIYMFDAHEDGSYTFPESIAYYGEVEFTMEYDGETSNPFSWLYLDYNTLKHIANDCQFECELVSEGNHYDYLARLTCK